MTDASFITDLTAACAYFAGMPDTGPLWLQALRREAAQNFRTLGLPTRKSEAWRYTSLRPVTSHQFRVGGGRTDGSEALTRSFVGKGEHALVFVDAQLSTSWSSAGPLPAGLQVTTLDAAIMRDEPLLRPSFERLLEEDKEHVFASLNGALARHGVVVKVAPGAKIKPVLHLVYVSGGDSGATAPAHFPRSLLHLEAGAEATVVESYLGPSSPYLVAPVTDTVLGDGARLTHVRLGLDGVEAIHLGRWHASLGRDAYLKSLSFLGGARLSRADIDVTLSSPGGQVDLDGLYWASGASVVDHHTLVDHRAPHCVSSQLYKGVLAGEGRGIFNGKVAVRRDASGTSARQMTRNLLLSPHAEADAKPELQIDTDDVKCSHGAAVGQLDDEQLFYLQSRGLPPETARRVLTLAYVDEVLWRLDGLDRVQTLLRERAGGLA